MSCLGCQEDTFGAFLTTLSDTVPLLSEKRALFEKKDTFWHFFQNQCHMYLFSVFSKLQLLLI